MPISDVCDRHGLRPGQFYTWQKQLFEQGAQVFHRTPDRNEREIKKKLQKLQKLQDQTREKDEVIAEVTKELVFLKNPMGELTGQWVPPSETVSWTSSDTGAGAPGSLSTLVVWLGIAPSKYFDWKKRYGRANEHNGQIPRDFWLEDWEREAIVAFHDAHPLEGYRRLTFVMLDHDVVAVSPSTTYRLLKGAERMRRKKPAKEEPSPIQQA
ncbi:MAG: transposase [Gemmatimonadota bacterium]